MLYHPLFLVSREEFGVLCECAEFHVKNVHQLVTSIEFYRRVIYTYWHFGVCDVERWEAENAQNSARSLMILDDFSSTSAKA